ncbi:hypothetical protein PIB30_108807, partial [Stylosanthes scabra]|nr:hypothetical protein [Stylosanthes scabra]
MEEIPAHEGTAESNPLPTPEKGIDQRNNTVHQLEAALRELLERQTREAALASEAVKRAEELARRQQAILEEAEKRERDRLAILDEAEKRERDRLAMLEEAEKRERERLEKLERLNGKTQTMANHSSRTAESQDRTWKASTVVKRAPGREKGRHPFSSRILAEEIPKKFRYPVEIEPYDGTTDPKHHLDAFENRMLLVNASDAIQ